MDRQTKFVLVFFLVFLLSVSLYECRKGKKKLSLYSKKLTKLRENPILSDKDELLSSSNSSLKTDMNTSFNTELTSKYAAFVPKKKELFKRLGFSLNKKIRKHPVFTLYSAYVMKHSDKIFQDAADFEIRMEKFATLKSKIENINSKETKYKLDLNMFSDRDISEVVESNTGLIPPDYSKIPNANMKQNFLETSLKVTAKTNLWEPLDWITQGKVTSVDAQSTCGSCWAFVAAGMFESFKSIKTNTAVEKISRQYFLDCLTPKTNNPGSCAGGHPIYASMFAKTTSFPSDSAYPYKAVQAPACPTNIGTPLTNFFTDFNVKQEVTPEELYTILQTKGPVAVNIDSAAQEFISYGGGVLTYKSASPAANHAVLIVGYGKEADGTEWWKIRNQWGTEWGEAGNAKISKTTSFIYTNIVELS